MLHPLQIGGLAAVLRLDLSHNALSGPVPVALAAGCAELSELDLSHNQLVGAIPPELGSLAGLWSPRRLRVF